MPDIWMDVDVALSEVPVNKFPLIDDTDFKTRETAVAYNAAGMDLVWNFVTPAGAYTQTAVTPTTGGAYDWATVGSAMYSIEIPASGGASINNDTEGFGWFTGYATGVYPWMGPIIGFRDAALNNAFIETAQSAAGGIPIKSDLAASSAVASEVWGTALHGTRTALQIVGVTIPSFIIGKTTGGGSVGTIVFRDPDDGFDAISMDVDADGDRSSVATSYS